VADRAHPGQERADGVDRPQDGVAPAQVDQAACLPEHAGQDEDGFVQILDQEVEPGQGIPEEQLFHAPADLVPVQEDVVKGAHILLMTPASVRSPGAIEIQ
jgi:hypothetical protein